MTVQWSCARVGGLRCGECCNNRRYIAGIVGRGRSGWSGRSGGNNRSSAHKPGHELHDPPAPPFRHNRRFPSSLIERLFLAQPLTRVVDILLVARQRVDRRLDEVAAGDDTPYRSACEGGDELASFAAPSSLNFSATAWKYPSFSASFRFRLVDESAGTFATSFSALASSSSSRGVVGCMGRARNGLGERVFLDPFQCALP